MAYLLGVFPRVTIWTRDLSRPRGTSQADSTGKERTVARPNGEYCTDLGATWDKAGGFDATTSRHKLFLPPEGTWD